ncbi:MAG: hypothetical protein E7523_08585 [Ruminococcaceae bacterium]|nr:hypothetical protein [Oscillospiraceae bacterium]
MKKLLLASLILCMLLFVACGNQSDPTEPADQPTQNMLEEDAQPTIADEMQEESTEAKQEIRGTVDGNTYRNEFIGIEITLDDTWTFYNDEQIAALYGLTADRAGEDFANLIENSPVVYDMYAMAANQVNNIGINLEKVDAVLLETMDLAANLQKSVDIIKTSYENMGYSDIQTEISTVEIDGQEFDCLNVSVSVGGMIMNQTTVSIKCGDYLASLALTALGEDSLAEILNSISLID